MRAAVVRVPGGPEAIEIIERPEPEPGPGEIVIAVEAAAVNPVDGQTRRGDYHALGWISHPVVGLGWDAAGRVSALGAAVDEYRVGDRVAALIGGVDRAHGAYAERVCLPARDAALIPDGLTAPQAAAVPLNALTADQALEMLGEAADRRLLITGAAGAVGSYAVELARQLGFRVTGLARAADYGTVTGSGAAHIDRLPEVQAFDAVLDAAAIGVDALDHVVDGGSYIGVIPHAVPSPTRSITVRAVMVAPDGRRLASLLQRAARGGLTPRVRAVLPLDRAQQAHQELELAGLRGRLVLAP